LCCPVLREIFTTPDYGSADMQMTLKNFAANIQKDLKLENGTSIGYPSELYSELPSSDFEGVWKVKDTAGKTFQLNDPRL
jgi:hypothetical protein